MKIPMNNWRRHLLTEDIKKEIEHNLIMFLESEDIDEGIMDRLLPYVLAGGAALGGMAGKAEAKPISQDVAAKRIVQVLNQKDIKDKLGLDVTFYDFDNDVQDVAKQISILSKTVPDKDENGMIDIVANGIEKNYKNEIPKDITFDTAADAVKLSISKIKEKQKSKKIAGAQEFTTGDSRMAAINSLNNIGSDLIQKRNPTESQSRFIKDLKIAKDQGTVSPEEYSEIRNIMTSDNSMKSKVLAVSKILNK
tara:strand:- start:136 stop:888 length:753 start_codon:yes stop_codon:yes gene_type:complete